MKILCGPWLCRYKDLQTILNCEVLFFCFRVGTLCFRVGTFSFGVGTLCANAHCRAFLFAISVYLNMLGLFQFSEPAIPTDAFGTLCANAHCRAFLFALTMITGQRKRHKLKLHISSNCCSNNLITVFGY